MGLFLKTISEQEVDGYQIAIKVIDMYIDAGSFNKAKIACNEILEKEKEALEKFKKYVTETKGEIQAKKDIRNKVSIFNTRKEHILQLKNKATLGEEMYIHKIEIENFKILFKKVKKQINQLLKLGKPEEAMEVLRELLKNHKDKSLAINYYNEEKIRIQKAIEKKYEQQKKKLESNAKAEAMNLIGKDIIEDKEQEKKYEKKSFWEKIKSFFIRKQNPFWSKLKKGIERDKLMKEFQEILKKGEVENNLGLKNKLKNIHKGLIKELKYDKLIGFDIYGKVLGADKISGDTFGLQEKKNEYVFYIGDATGHGIKAGLIVTLINQAFRKYISKDFKTMVMEINNTLKQSLESKNFITGIFFHIDKFTHTVKGIGMGHEPLLIYKKETKEVIQQSLGGVASGIMQVENTEVLNEYNIQTDNMDIIMTYSDGIIEARNTEGELYGIERLKESFESIAKTGADIQTIYKQIINDLHIFTSSTNYLDDVSIILIQRNIEKDLISKEDFYLDEIQEKEGLNKKEVKELEGKSKSEIQQAVEEIKRKKETKRIIAILKDIYYNGEILKLKQEAIRYIKEGYIHKDINKYLKKAIEQENAYKIEQKNQKMQNTYKVLEELYKKGDYDTVIGETENIIAKDGLH